MKFHSLIFVLFSVVTICFSACQNESKTNYTQLQGKAQGTTYTITFSNPNELELQQSIDSILKVIDFSMSTYRKESIISRLNQGDSVALDVHFTNVLKRSMELFHESGTKFNPLVRPLVKFWGFAGSRISAPDSIDPKTIDSLLTLLSPALLSACDSSGNCVPLDSLALRAEMPQLLRKNDPRAELDFNAIAQGYTVDVICEFLEAKLVHNYMVELGGELRTKGNNREGSLWRIGIDKPNAGGEENRQLQTIVCFTGKALATSGNYRKFFEKDGKRYSHAIDVKTGYPAMHSPSILSASVLTSDCMSADAYATILMCSSLKEAIQFSQSNPEIEVYLIYADDTKQLKTYVSKGFQKILIE